MKYFYFFIYHVLRRRKRWFQDAAYEENLIDLRALLFG